MSIDDLLDMMDETLEDAFTVPLTGKRMVDVEKMRDIIDDIRLNMPAEIREAKAIVQNRNEIVSDAKKEADGLIKKAEKQAAALVSEQEIVKQSQEKAGEISLTAQQQARDLRNRVTSYCDNMLRQTEEQLAKSTGEVKALRASVRQHEKK